MVIVGLTRRQKQEYLAVLKRSKTELISPNSSTASKNNNVDAESTDSEFALGKKKKKNKKKMVIESEDESSIILAFHQIVSFSLVNYSPIVTLFKRVLNIFKSV